MLRWGRRVGLVATALLVAVVSAWRITAAAGPPATGHHDPAGTPAKALEIYYTPPVLVRAGERVIIPADVLCATAAGSSCDARATLGTKEADGAWRLTSTVARPELEFDVSGPAGRAVDGSSSGSVSFFLGATGPGGAATSLPVGGSGSPLRFYVVRAFPTARLPATRFGQVREPKTVLYLPWGSGPDRAGLQVGREFPTQGPPAFDVDRSGRVYVLDALQQRVAVFSGGRLVRQTRVRVAHRADIAITPRGAAFVLDEAGSSLLVRRIGPSGKVSAISSLGPGILSQIRTAGENAVVNVLPMDAWVRVRGSESDRTLEVESAHPTVARPLPDGRGLLRVGSQSGVRLGFLFQSTVHNAVELRSSDLLGEVALAEPDGPAGYLVVVHVWRDSPTRADQYQVVRISNGRIVETFATPDGRFAETGPLSRFRLGQDGHLYQLIARAEGMRIVRYDIGGES